MLQITTATLREFACLVLAYSRPDSRANFRAVFRAIGSAVDGDIYRAFYVGILRAATLTAATLTIGSLAVGRPSTALAGPPPVVRPCDGAMRDGRIIDAGLGHNSFDLRFRSPFGAIPAKSGTITLRLRTCANDVERVQLRVWDSVQRKENWIALQREPGVSFDTALGRTEFWSATFTFPQSQTILYYSFSAHDRDESRFYTDDDPRIDGGGWGVSRSQRDDFASYQITVYDPAFEVPEWLKGRFVYQIFPDRFRNGDRSNDPKNGGSFVFGSPVRFQEWTQPICDPYEAACRHEFGNQFYGGDLQGIIEKLDELQALGVGALYLNPIFSASTNHRYDTADYRVIDEELGDLSTFQKLVREAKKRSIHLILDGVFNHMSADSPAFDLYQRWPGTGACESTDSIYRSWFIFSEPVHSLFSETALTTALRTGLSAPCSGSNGLRVGYESWWGYPELPVLNRNAPEVRKLFFADGEQSVGPSWIKQGAAGWRLDVGGDIDPGATQDPSNRFWEEFRTAVKAASPDAVILGEEWGDASPWLTGWEWDSVMNYRFREVLLSWLADGCSGLGCTNGWFFEDNDSRSDRINGPISPISESRFDNRLRSIQEDYPPQAWHAMLNLLGSHDTNRILFILKKISSDDETVARRKLMFGSIFLFTYPGAPTLYYGDEAGVGSEGRWHFERWMDDPYNRAVYPWSDKGLTPDQGLIEHVRRLANLRARTPALLTGDYQTLEVDDSRRVLAFRRSIAPIIGPIIGPSIAPSVSRSVARGMPAGFSVHLARKPAFDSVPESVSKSSLDSSAHSPPNSEVIVVLNRAAQTQDVNLHLPLTTSLEGALFEDALNGGVFQVKENKLNLGQVSGLWGRILIRK